MELSQLYDNNMSNKMPKQEMYLTIDVMTNILNRLPSISILRFQTVSKYWCYIIHDILNARSKSSLNSIQLSIDVSARRLTIISFDDEGKMKTSDRDINLGSIWCYNFSNMVNGLACAYGNKSTATFYLVNLTTLETSRYLKRKIEGRTLYNDDISLGFDPSTGLYKFIRINSHFMGDSYHCEILEVGVLFKGNWKIIGKIPHSVELDNPVFSNGAIHWKMISLSGKSLDFDFVKLDMKEEKFEMVAPTLQNEFDIWDYKVCNCDYHYYFTLTEENGNLYVLHYCCRKKYLYGWRLKESKGNCVWNVVFHVNIASMIDEEPRCLLGNAKEPYVVGIVDGKVLIRSKEREGVYIYDLLHKKLSKHWDVYCGRTRWERGSGRMFFNHRDVFRNVHPAGRISDGLGRSSCVFLGKIDNQFCGF